MSQVAEDRWMPVDSSTYLLVAPENDGEGTVEVTQLELFDLDELADALPDPAAGNYYLG